MKKILQSGTIQLQNFFVDITSGITCRQPRCRPWQDKACSPRSWQNAKFQLAQAAYTEEPQGDPGGPSQDLDIKVASFARPQGQDSVSVSTNWSLQLQRNKFRVLSKFSLSLFSRRGRLSRGCCTVHCRCAVVVTMFELSKSISVSRLALESGPSNSFPSPLSVSLDIVVSFGSWFATPLGVDLVSAPCSAWPGGNRRRGGVDEPRHRARRGGVGGWDYL
jgi:hypothetical protein